MWGDSSCGRQGEATSLSSFKAGGEIQMHFEKNILSIACRRDGAEMAGEDVGRPKGECNSEEPESRSPSPCRRCAVGPDPAFPTC